VADGLEILVGKRLLITIIPFDHVENPETDIPSILEQGRCVRDEKGFNRYRLVIIGVRNNRRYAELQAMASTLDERLHIHLLDEHELCLGEDEV
jgi:hypothetical protein